MNLADLNVMLKRADTIATEIDQLHEAITRRAYQLFLERNGQNNIGYAEWLEAEREVVVRPAVDVRQTDGEYALTISVADIEIHDIEVILTPDEALIRGQISRGNGQAQLFRVIHFSSPVRPNAAEIGLAGSSVTVWVPLARQAPQGLPKEGMLAC